MNENETPNQSVEAPASPAEPRQSHFALLLRLWASRKIAPVATGLSVPMLVILSLLWLSLWVAIDWWDALPDPQFLAAGVPLFAWYALAVLALAALMRWQSRPMPTYGATLTLALGLVPLPLLLAAIAAPNLSQNWLLGVTIAALIYSLFYLARGLRAFTGES